jgi:hypothetical protein
VQRGGTRWTKKQRRPSRECWTPSPDWSTPEIAGGPYDEACHRRESKTRTLRPRGVAVREALAEWIEHDEARTA